MWTLAWRNVWRRRSRSLVTVGVVGSVVFFTLVFFAFTEATKTGMFQVLTEESGHLLITSATAKEARDFDATLIREAAAVEAAIARELPGALVARALDVPALVSGETRSRGVRLTGIEHDAALRERFQERHLVSGRLPAPESLDEIALGAALARALRVELGDLVYVFAPGTEGWGAAAYVLVGLLQFPQSTAEVQAAVLSLVGAQELAAPGAASRFEIHLPAGREALVEARVKDAKDRLATAFGDSVSVEDWREASPDLAALLDLMDPVMTIFAAFLFILAGLFVVNTVYLGLVERIREFGVIIAVGADRWRVMRMVLSESLVLVLTGTAFGLAFAGALVAGLSGGFSIPGMEEIMEEFGLPAVLYPSVTAGQVVTTMAFAVGVALLAALWPAWKAGRLQPVEAMRHVA